MNTQLDAWYHDSQVRRRASQRGGPLAASLFGSIVPNAETSVAAARVVLESLGRRSVRLGLEQGISRANLETGEVNLDGGILEADAPWPLRAERLLGVAAHEASHLLWTPLEPFTRDRLFRAIQNILEDERIEARLASERRDFIHPLHVARRDLLSAASHEGYFLSAFFTLVRCEQRLDPALWGRYQDRLCAVVEALTPFPKTFTEVRFASLAIALQVPPEERDMIPDPELFGALVAGDASDDSRSLPDFLRHHKRRGRRRRPRPPSSREVGKQSRQLPAWPAVTWSSAENARDGYERVRSDVAARARVLADRLRTLLPRRRAPRQNSGRIDRKRLYASPYSTAIFRAPGSQGPTLAIAILVDLSGSMQGRSARIAQQVGVLVSEAARALPDVRLSVFGHRADLEKATGTQMVRFPLNAEGRPLGLGRLPIRGNNRDAHALRELGTELLGSPMLDSRHRIAIVIADGAPSARDFEGDEAIRHTREAITWLDQAWGPVLFIATDDADTLREMVPGASFRFRSGDAVEELSQHLTLTLKRSLRGAL
jgi:hypothetical protein